jgi:Peptidase family M1 domain
MMKRPEKRILIVAISSVFACVVAGCASQYEVRATDYQINLQLEPENHKLAGRARLTLEPLDDSMEVPDEVWVGLDLNKDLKVTSVVADGGRVRRTRATKPRAPSDHGDPSYRTHRVYLDELSGSLTLTVEYEGELNQDVAAGEKAGQIHNFGVSAHIGPEGTYLSPGGHYYPTPAIDDLDKVDPDLLLADWTVQANDLDGYQLVATAYRDERRPDAYYWKSPHKLTGLAISGGPHDVWTRSADGVDFAVHMKSTDDPEAREDNHKIAEKYLDHVITYVELYEPLLGPFPYKKFTIIENFFSSGFAFPTLTLFGPAVMHMGDNSFRHGYLDHEFIHGWWGCGVEVDPRDGNWCEALTSYCTNHYGFYLEGDDEGARKRRRDYSNFLSRLRPKYDKPLATFGRPGGAGRGIAYSKGAAVFHMIARKIGQDEFWEACRQVTDKFTGRHANWDDLKAAFEAAGGQPLDTFFAQWVRGSGAPALELVDASYDRKRSLVTVTIDQGETSFELDVPLRVNYADRSEDVSVAMDESKQTVDFAVSDSPVSVELDPDYHVFRKLKVSEIMPTTAITKSARNMIIVVPAGEYPKAYDTVAESFETGVKKKKDGHLVRAVADDDLTVDMLSNGGVLILGDAVRHPAVQELLARTKLPLRWIDGGFAVGDSEFTTPADAVLCTIHHPDKPKDGITIYAGNSEDALGNAAILGYYANSLLVFKTADRADVVLRRDFEPHQTVMLGGVE